MTKILGQISVMLPCDLISNLISSATPERTIADITTLAVSQLLEDRKLDGIPYRDTTVKKEKKTLWLGMHELIAARAAADEDRTTYSALMREALARFLDADSSVLPSESLASVMADPVTEVQGDDN